MFDEAYFDAGLDRRGTATVKWDVTLNEYGADALPMWVADMDFACAPPITEALSRRAAHPSFGYTLVEEADLDALRGYWARRHGLGLEREDITLLPCVVTGIKAAIHATTQPGETVVLMSPVYGPFAEAIRVTGRQVADAPLLRDADGGVRMNLEAIERHLRDGAGLILLCSPHNPVSRPWTEDELRDLLALADRYAAFVVSDEIHADFVYAPDVFVPILSLRQERTLSLCAPSKTFNLAGLQLATCVCPDERLRRAIQHALASGGAECGNLFGLTAARAAYTEGDAWLDGLLRYLDGNRQTLGQAVAASLPCATLSPIRATYLAWLDLTATGLKCEELTARTRAQGVHFVPGTAFGAAGEGHLRINFACPRDRITEAVRRLAAAIA